MLGTLAIHADSNQNASQSIVCTLFLANQRRPAIFKTCSCHCYVALQYATAIRRILIYFSETGKRQNQRLEEILQLGCWTPTQRYYAEQSTTTHLHPQTGGLRFWMQIDSFHYLWFTHSSRQIDAREIIFTTSTNSLALMCT